MQENVSIIFIAVCIILTVVGFVVEKGTLSETAKSPESTPIQPMRTEETPRPPEGSASQITPVSKESGVTNDSATTNALFPLCVVSSQVNLPHLPTDNISPQPTNKLPDGMSNTFPSDTFGAPSPLPNPDTLPDLDTPLSDLDTPLPDLDTLPNLDTAVEDTQNPPTDEIFDFDSIDQVNTAGQGSRSADESDRGDNNLTPGRLSKARVRECQKMGEQWWKEIEELAKLWNCSTDLIARACGILSNEQRSPNTWNIFQEKWMIDNKFDPVKGALPIKLH